MVTNLFIQTDHRMGVLWLVLAFPSNMVLPDLASIFSAKFWAIIKILEQIKDSVAPKYIIFLHLVSCPQDLQYMKLQHPSIGLVIQKIVFLNFDTFLLGTQPK